MNFCDRRKIFGLRLRGDKRQLYFLVQRVPASEFARVEIDGLPGFCYRTRVEE